MFSNLSPLVPWASVKFNWTYKQIQIYTEREQSHCTSKNMAAEYIINVIHLKSVNNDIAEIVLKVALNTITLTLTPNCK